VHSPGLSLAEPYMRCHDNAGLGKCDHIIVVASLSGEIVLKSRRVRPRFERRLLSNIADALAKWNVKTCSRPRLWDARILIGPCRQRDEYCLAMDALLHVFGVHAVTVACMVTHSGLDDLALRVEEIASEWVRSRTFAVRARRSGVEPFTSIEAARTIGARLLPYSAGVNLGSPDVEVHVEVRGTRAIIHKGFVRGAGGLPIGVEGRALVLFSGGFDSPLAAWFTAKRGVEVDFLHYILATPLSLNDARRVASREKSLWLHGYRPRLLAIDFRRVTSLIASKVSESYRQVVLRVAMLDAAEEVAVREGYQAIITGESLGQVSSQTLQNIYALTLAKPRKIPVLRPLIGLDKEEIIEYMRRIGLYSEAEKTKEYCRLTQGPATTKAKVDKLVQEYSLIRGEVEKALETLQVEYL